MREAAYYTFSACLVFPFSTSLKTSVNARGVIITTVQSSPTTREN